MSNEFFKNWPSKSRVKVMGEVTVESHNVALTSYRLTSVLFHVNYASPVYGVATICHQVRWLRWGHPSLFHIATSLLIWYKMFCVRDISYRLIWMEPWSHLGAFRPRATALGHLYENLSDAAGPGYWPQAVSSTILFEVLGYWPSHLKLLSYNL